MAWPENLRKVWANFMRLKPSHSHLRSAKTTGPRKSSHVMCAVTQEWRMSCFKTAFLWPNYSGSYLVRDWPRWLLAGFGLNVLELGQHLLGRVFLGHALSPVIVPLLQDIRTLCLWSGLENTGFILGLVLAWQVRWMDWSVVQLFVTAWGQRSAGWPGKWWDDDSGNFKILLSL